jgi:hypothetical protein
LNRIGAGGRNNIACIIYRISIVAFDRHFLGNDIRVLAVLGREQTREGFWAVIERFAEFLLALEMPLTEIAFRIQAGTFF